MLALMTVVLYWPATRHGFVGYDDNYYVTENSHVQGGLTWAGVKWAFLNPMVGNWHPLTVLSHMLDCQIFGLNPWGHHLVNVLLHAANTVLVFLLLLRLTSPRPEKGAGASAVAEAMADKSGWQAGALWRSVMVAGLFGWHPLHVESVAWVAERKDVLSTLFGLLSLLFYVRYTQNKTTLNPQPSTFNYLLALVFFGMGLMSKAMLVTWPFVMLLLDWWPLKRFTIHDSRFTIWSLIREKLLFFALAVVSSVVTFFVQKSSNAVSSLVQLPLTARLENAAASYVTYLARMFWPVDLAVFYPYPGSWPIKEVTLAGGLLLGITGLCVVARRHYPFMLMGWLWYVGTLVPVIGLVQVGEQAMADRYTYIPSLGILILTVWGISETARRWRYQVEVLSVMSCAAVMVCLGLTRQQLEYWTNDETLFRHAIEVTKNNYLAHKTLGDALCKKGQLDAAITEYQEAIRLHPQYAEVHNNLGTALLQKGRVDGAISQFQEAIRLNPRYADAYFDLGIALYQKGRTDETINQFQEAIRLQPDFAEAHFNLGCTLLEKGQANEAVIQFQEAIRLKPNYAEAHYSLGNVLIGEGRLDEAIDQFQKTVQLKPDDAPAHNNLGIAFYQKGQLDAAISQIQEAIRLKPDFAEARSNLWRVLETKNASTNQ